MRLFCLGKGKGHFFACGRGINCCSLKQTVADSIFQIWQLYYLLAPFSFLQYVFETSPMKSYSLPLNLGRTVTKLYGFEREGCKVCYIFLVHLDCLFLKKPSYCICIIPRGLCGEGHVKKNLDLSLVDSSYWALIWYANVAVMQVSHVEYFSL